MVHILETDRLILRELVTTDAPDFFNLNLDPEVIQYTGDQAFGNIAGAEDFLKNYDHYLKYGFGRWAVIKKTNNEFLGWCGLKYTEETAEYDLGFRFFRKNWNTGYATESAIACLDLGFKKFGIEKVVGRVMKVNTRSIHVLEKMGFSFLKTIDFAGEPGLVYQIDKSGFNPLLS